MFDEHFGRAGCFPCYSGESWWFVTGPSAATLSVIITINKYGVQWLLFKVSVMKLCYLIFFLFNYYLICRFLFKLCFTFMTLK